MKKALLLMVIVIFFAGCTISEERIHPDVITVPEEDYVVHNTQPFAGDATTIEFNVVNEGKDTMNGIEVNFFDPSVFKVLSLNCGTKSSKSGEKSCILDNMESGKTRKVAITLLAPDDDIKSPTPVDVKFYIKYDFTGSRTAIVPVVESVEEPPKEYKPSGPSDGPVQLEFTPPVGGEQKQGQQTIERQWAHKDIPFEMKMSFKHVGSKKFGDVKEPIVIKAGNLKIDLDGAKVASIGGKGVCRFFNDQGKSVVSKEDILVPDEISCSFISSREDFDKYYNMVFDASFTYTYQIIKTERFVIRPIESQ